MEGNRHKLSIPKRQFTAIELPMYISTETKNERIKLKTKTNELFGGHENVKETIESKDGSLELHLRPDDPFSHPIFGTRVKTSNILLKVKTKRQAGDTNKSNKKITSVEAMGTISNTIRFNGLADFQFIPPDRHRTPKHGNQSISTEIQELIDQCNKSDKPDKKATQSKPTVPFLPPATFAETDKPLPFLFKRRIRQASVQKLDVSSNRDGAALVWDIVEDENPPTKLPPEHPFLALDENQLKKSVYKEVEDLFNQRPCWRKSQIKELVSKCNQKELKEAIGRVAYRTTKGPFNSVYLKFGFNPKKDPKSRIYQVLPMRFNTSIDVMSNAKFKNGDKTKKRKLNIEAPTEFIVCGIDLKQNTSTCLCDFRDHELRSHLKAPLPQDRKYDNQHGWFTSHELIHFRNCIKNRYARLEKRMHEILRSGKDWPEDAKDADTILMHGNCPSWDEEHWSDEPLPNKYKTIDTRQQHAPKTQRKEKVAVPHIEEFLVYEDNEDDDDEAEYGNGYNLI